MRQNDPEELLGSLEGFISFVADNTELLTQKGINSALIKTNLEGMKSDLSAKKSDRDNKKTELAAAQAAFETSGDTTYRAFSNTVDTIAGALGKQTPKGLQVLGYRKSVVGKTKSSAKTANPKSPPAQ